MILSKYAAALLQVAIIFGAALQAAQTDGLTETEVWQLAALLVGAIVTFFAPILDSQWAGALKVGGAVLGGIIAAIIPFVTQGWSAEAATIVVLAGLNALATQLGVSVRIDAVRELVADDTISNSVPYSVDRRVTDMVLAHS